MNVKRITAQIKNSTFKAGNGCGQTENTNTAMVKFRLLRSETVVSSFSVSRFPVQFPWYRDRCNNWRRNTVEQYHARARVDQEKQRLLRHLNSWCISEKLCWLGFLCYLQFSMDVELNFLCGYADFSSYITFYETWLIFCSKFIFSRLLITFILSFNTFWSAKVLVFSCSWNNNSPESTSHKFIEKVMNLNAFMTADPRPYECITNVIF